MRGLRAIIWVVCLGVLTPSGAALAQEVDPTLAPLDDAAPLPVDSRLEARTLDNGLRVLALSHPSPPGRVLVWVRVGVGSLDERADELGYARLAQETSLAGVRGGEWQAALDRLARRGLDPGEAFGGQTRRDQTLFWIALPEPGDEALNEGLWLLKRVVFDASLGPAEAGRARDLALASLRAAGGAEARARTQWLPELTGDSLIGTRPAMGDERSLLGAGEAGVLAFRSAWYTPSNTTVMIVGDIDARAAADRVEKWFGAQAARGTPARQDRGIGTPDTRRVALGSDEELGGSQLAIVCIQPPAGTVRTYADFRRFVLAQTAIRALDARVNAAIAEGRLDAIDQGVYVADIYGSVRISQLAVDAPADGWRRTLAQLCGELQRVREHGFTRAETEEAIARTLTRLEDYAEVERSLPAGEVMGWLNYNDAAGHVWMSLGAELELARRVLVGVEASELTREIRGLFPQGAESVLVSAPEEGADRDRVLAIASGALDGPTEAPTEPAPTRGLVARAPDGGAVVELSAHPPTGVWSAWLSNNVRVHHRAAPGSEGRVVVRATIGGNTPAVPAAGAAEGESSLLADACAQAWARPAVAGLSSVQVRRLLAGTRVTVDARADGGVLTLEIDASPGDLVSAFELAHRLLRDPVLDGPALERWRRERLAALRRSGHDPVERIEDGLESLVEGRGDFRGVDERAAEISGVTLDDASAWLRELVADAPLEVAVVGDVSRTDALELGERYLGSLPERERVAPPAPGQTRGARISRVERLQTQTRIAGVMTALTPRAGADTPDGLMLAVAARVLQARLSSELRDQRRLVSDVTCGVRAARGGGAGSVLFVKTACEPGQSELVSALVGGAIESLARRPAGEDEVAAAASQVAGERRDALATPEHWALRLSSLDRRGGSIDDIVGADGVLDACTPQDVRDAMARCVDSALWLSVLTRPTDE